MTTAKLLVSRNSNPWESGGIIASLDDVIVLGMLATDGVRPSSRYELYGVPPGYPLPAGWTDQGDGTWYRLVTAGTATFTLSQWGKYMLALRLNGANDLDPFLVDFSTALSVLDADGKEDVGRFETDQFHAEWSEALRITFRVLIGGGGGSDPTKLARNGSNAMTADLPFGGHNGVNAADPINNSDVDTKGARNTALAAYFTAKVVTGTVTLTTNGHAAVPVTLASGSRVFIQPTSYSAVTGRVLPQNVTTSGFELQSSEPLDRTTFNYVAIAPS